MSAASLLAEAARSRVRIRPGRPPEGTPSRILKTRFHRSTRRPFAHPAPGTTPPSPLSSSLPPAAARGSFGRGGRSGPFRPPPPTSGPANRQQARMPAPDLPPVNEPEPAVTTEKATEEFLLLRKMLLATPPPAVEVSAGHQHPQPPSLLPTTTHEPTSTTALDASDWRTKRLLDRLRASDTRAVYRWLVPTAGHPDAKADAAASAEPDNNSSNSGHPLPLADERDRRYAIAASLPPTVFSELLRCLDPVAVRRHCDAAQSIPISAGLAQFTPLGAHVDQYGIRMLYTALLQALLAVYALRVAPTQNGGGGGGGGSAHPILLHDYVALLRCAGAASDVAALRRYEAALLAYAETARQAAHVESSPKNRAGPGAGAGAAAVRLQRAALTKWHMWYCMHTWCRGLLKGLRPRGASDPNVVRMVPQLLDAYRPFLFADGLVRYRTATGAVQLREPQAHRKVCFVPQTVEVPVLRPHIKYQYRTVDATGQYVPEAAAAETWPVGNAAAAAGPAGVDTDADADADADAPAAALTTAENDVVVPSHRDARRVVRRRTMRVRQFARRTPDLRQLGRKTPRAWLVREFA
ncbi:hypothetical protein SPI_03704 [Niveomyces insectorum RCEF 264]|uniref:Uncharacterized protein n=1 Tax=Niveomyces insectorum RCEF 264 TaxID=1081102 RepID=A0A167WAH7_9HYPO|nr:hypothetical protein SPI_03704 [Niveomyces insectorum RCEF 264]